MMSKQKITVFAISSDYTGYSFDCDGDKVHEYYKTHGYGFMLTFSSEVKELINELKAIKYVIDTLSEWQSCEWFKLNKTTYEIDWFNCLQKRRETGKTIVTLPQAKKLYKNTKYKYDLLVGIIQETFRVHNKDYEGKEYRVENFLSDIEI